MSTQFIEPIAALECLQNEFNSETKEFKNTLNLNDMIKLDIVKSPYGNSFNMKAQQGNIVFSMLLIIVFLIMMTNSRNLSMGEIFSSHYSFG
jgi:hypothetical protein